MPAEEDRGKSPAMVKERLEIPCPLCGRPMRFAGAQPASGVLQELWRFECAGCEQSRVTTKPEAVGLANAAKTA